MQGLQALPDLEKLAARSFSNIACQGKQLMHVHHLSVLDELEPQGMDLLPQGTLCQGGPP